MRSRHKRSEGSRLFAAFVQKYHLTPTQIAVALEVSRAVAYSWTDESKRPDAYHRAAIEVWTGGRIRVTAWLTKTEQAQLAAIVPFVAAD